MHKLFNVQRTGCSGPSNTVSAVGPREAAERWADDVSLGDGEHATLKIWQADINSSVTTWTAHFLAASLGESSWMIHGISPMRWTLNSLCMVDPSGLVKHRS